MAYKDHLGIIQCGTIKLPVSNPELYKGTEIEKWHGKFVLNIECYETQEKFQSYYARDLNWEEDTIYVGGAEDSQEVVVFITHISSQLLKNNLLSKLREYFLNNASIKFQVQKMLPKGWDYEKVEKWIHL